MSDQIITAVTPGQRPGLFLLEQAPAATAPTECEAQRRNLQALHAMEVNWGRGVFDYGKVRALLTGTREACTRNHTVTAPRTDTVA